jgi:hypothetical protein
MIRFEEESLLKEREEFEKKMVEAATLQLEK